MGGTTTSAAADADRGYRNGVREGRLKTAEGIISFSAPQIADTVRSRFDPEIRQHLARVAPRPWKTTAIELLARGLSVRDIEEAFKDERAAGCCRKTAVSEIGARLWADYQEFPAGVISASTRSFIFVDGIAERIRPGRSAEPVLAAWGIATDGKKVLLGLMAGSKEDAETVVAFPGFAHAGSAIRFWSSVTVHLASSRRSRPASTLGPASAACPSHAQSRGQGS
ncbi:MAG: transposase [Geminicoccaceae bacterium]|nr:transposase [Geminicoccaceae bacterium]